MQRRYCRHCLPEPDMRVQKLRIKIWWHVTFSISPQALRPFPHPSECGFPSKPVRSFPRVFIAFRGAVNRKVASSLFFHELFYPSPGIIGLRECTAPRSKFLCLLPDWQSLYRIVFAATGSTSWTSLLFVPPCPGCACSSARRRQCSGTIAAPRCRSAPEACDLEQPSLPGLACSHALRPAQSMNC